MKRKTYHELAHELANEMSYDYMKSCFTIYQESGIYTLKHCNGTKHKVTTINSGMTAKECYRTLLSIRSYIESVA